MAMRLSCCLRAPPPQAPDPPFLAKILAPWTKKDETSEKSRPYHVVGAACFAAAGAVQLCCVEEPAVASVGGADGWVGVEKRTAGRWSERRLCPPWRENSLETIVPENLPRPAARRRWENVDFGGELVGPPIRDTAKATKSRPGCFSM